MGQFSLNKTVAIITIVALLLAGGGGALYYFSSNSSENVDTAAAGNAKGSREESHYMALEPPFIVNFTYKDTLRYLQMTLSLMTHDKTVIEQVNHHMPAIRHRLIMLLSDKSFHDLNGEESKEKLRGEMLVEIRNILQAENNKTQNAGRVEALYFTGYVMQ